MTLPASERANSPQSSERAEPCALEDSAPALAKSRRVWFVLIAAAAFVVLLLGFTRLWKEWKDLEQIREATRESTYIGYVNIQPRAGGGSAPNNWYAEQDDSVLLWSGRRPGAGSSWFHFQKGEIERSRLSGGFGKDVIPAIDRPLVEIGDGLRWRRLNADAKVVGVNLNGIDTVYPLLLMEKVEAVNDLIWGRPFLATYSPVGRPDGSVEVFSPLVNGKRATFGTSGYRLDGEPLLFDRETESLWIRKPEGLTALTGRLKGTILKRIARPSVVAWTKWSSSHPQSRLIVGSETIDYPADSTSERR